MPCAGILRLFILIIFSPSTDSPSVQASKGMSDLRTNVLQCASFGAT